MAQNNLKEYVRTEFLDLSLRGLLKARHNILLGVSEEAEQQPSSH